MELDESNKNNETLQSMNKSEVFHSSLIRPIAKLLVPKSKSQFRLTDDPGSHNWNDYRMNGGKVSLYDDQLLFRDTGVVFTLRRDIFSMMTDYDMNKTDSPDPKHFVNFMDGMHFDIHTKVKSSGDKNLIRNYHNIIKALY